MLQRLASGVALVATVALALTACTPGAPEESPTATASASAEPTPRSSGRADSDVAADAFDKAQTFNRLVDQAFQDGALPLAALQSVASPEMIEVLQTDLDGFTSRGLRLEGSSALEAPMLVTHARTSADSGSVVLATCMDTSGATTLDSNGEAISGGVERQPRLFELRYSVESMVVIRTGPPETPLELPGCTP